MFAYAKLTIFYDITYLLLHKLCDKGYIRAQYAKNKKWLPRPLAEQPPKFSFVAKYWPLSFGFGHNLLCGKRKAVFNFG